MRLTIGVRTHFIGMHCWPLAPEHRSYLATPHRHKFGVEVSLSVKGRDREVEYHDLLQTVQMAIPDESVVTLTDARNPYLNMSCEHHAARLAGILAERYPSRSIKVTVDEDSECFSTYEIP